MDPKFIIQYDFTYELYKTWSKHPVGRKHIRNKKKFTVTFAVLAAACLALMIINAVSKNWGDVRSFAYPFGLSTLTLFVVPPIARKIYYKKLRKLYKNNMTLKIILAENINFENSAGSIKLEYPEIIIFTEDESNFIIYTSFDSGYRIPKSSFIKGDNDSLRKFLQSKINFVVLPHRSLCR